MIPVILSGGSGSRLWPLSRQSHPKQFLALHTQNTLFQETILRLNKLNFFDPIVVCSTDHRFIVAENIQDIQCKAQDIILEPVGRNTAPAIAVAALTALEKGEDPVILVLPADHAIENEGALATAFETAKEMAEKDYLVTFGVKPTEPHAGYGYIKVGNELGNGANEIESFIEKPDGKKAQIFLDDGGYFWNSGMFCFKASRFLSELELYQPELLQNAKESLFGANQDADFIRLDYESFEKCTNISIDYAVMEKTKKGCVVGIDAQWNDIGAWDSVWNISDKDQNGNVTKGDTIVQKSQNNFVHADHKLVVALGVDNLIIIETSDVLLVANKDKAQEVKDIVEHLKEKKREEVIHHAKVEK